MRILQLNHIFEEHGGAEVYFRSLARWQVARGHEVSLFASSDTESRDEPDLCVVRRPAFDLGRLIEDVQFAEPFKELCRTARPELIHVHNLYSFPVSLIATICASGVPVVQTVHDLSLVCTNGWCVLPDGRVCAGGPGRKCLEEGCESNAPYDVRIVLAAALRLEAVRAGFGAFVSPSEFVADKCRESGLENVHVVPYRVDPDWVTERIESREEGPPTILFAGRLAKEKGLTTLLEATPKVASQIPDVRLLLAGAGEEEARLRALARELNIESRVDFLGHMERSGVLELLESVTVLAVPSHWCENSPVSCYESLLAGLPIVASRIGGIPELVPDGVAGLLAEPREPADFADKLVRVLGDRELRQSLSQGARQEAARYTSVDEHLDRLDTVYSSALSRPPSRPGPAAHGDDLLALIGRLNLRYSQMIDWSIAGGRPRRMIEKALTAVIRGPKKPPLGRP